MTKSSAPTETGRKTLAEIAAGKYYLANSGKVSSGLRAPTVESLRKAGFVDVNGAARSILDGSPARRLVVTPAGRQCL